ncbi:NUDIX domain-containing protein [Aquimarina gracilis]|uniref:NUDIX domain-containing protein n=1 Tax=Aquimarina gracilis TaxID=874422 RepID=A0ABU6A2L9_9FLAO|nr:NUDIX domain-containing protein [Aquimarina gracilis]MEB3348336.1 NUDIX domain-containing protein [Aquimarina gracilis]
MADEFIDVLDKTGKPTGDIKLKTEAHRLGLYHASIHVWFYTVDGKVLFQKRASNKDTFPNLWDVSVAGHIGTGELPLNSAIREIEEEIGLKITKNDLEFVTIYLSKKTPKPDIFDNEFHHIYLSKLSTPIHTLVLQEEEVAAVSLFEIKTFKDIVNNKERNNEFVPHDKAYYTLVLKEITNRL